MIVRSKAPLRIGLAGGGTDVPPYCDKYTGYILNSTVDMYVHCTLEVTNSATIEFVSENLDSSVVYRSSKKLELNGEFDLYKAIYNRIVSDFVDEPLSFKLHSFSEAPPGSGLGGSSTLIVAVIKAFSEWLNLALGVYDIARLAYTIERKDLGWSGGKQDQYAATFGGFNFMEFSEKNHVVVNPLGIKNWIVNELEASCFMAFTGVSRKSSSIIDCQTSGVSEGKNNVILSMHKLKEGAFQMKKCLLNGDIKGVATILDESWVAKKNTSPSVSNKLIDEIVEAAKEAGAWSCKVSGAGGGGFMFFMVEPLLKNKVMKTVESRGLLVKNVIFSQKGTQAWKIRKM
jgi:D-glycero-alpha-D-manno-heptose-7-phosphate kinase